MAYGLARDAGPRGTRDDSLPPNPLQNLMDLMTHTALRKAETRYQRAFARSEQARLDRDALILEALEAGWTHARIAEATGLTRGRIGQLAQRFASKG